MEVTITLSCLLLVMYTVDNRLEEGLIICHEFSVITMKCMDQHIVPEDKLPLYAICGASVFSEYTYALSQQS